MNFFDISKMGKFLKILSHPQSSKLFSTIVQNEIKKNKKPCQKPSVFVRTFTFCNKVLIVGSLFYYTASKGVWGTPEQAQNFICHHCHLESFKTLIPLHIRTLMWPNDK
jgi:hypothetical protein